MSSERFEDAKPELQLEKYFLGSKQATGLFEDRFGNIRRQFVVDITGRMDGNTLVLDERFSYQDGTHERRVWSIERESPTSYIGRADDILDVAHGRVSGNAIRWTYKTKISVNGSSWTVSFDDWMFLQQNGVLMNRATVSRLGIKIGTVLIAFHDVPKNQPSPGSSKVDPAVHMTDQPIRKAS